MQEDIEKWKAETKDAKINEWGCRSVNYISFKKGVKTYAAVFWDCYRDLFCGATKSNDHVVLGLPLSLHEGGIDSAKNYIECLCKQSFLKDCFAEVEYEGNFVFVTLNTDMTRDKLRLASLCFRFPFEFKSFDFNQLKNWGLSFEEYLYFNQKCQPTTFGFACRVGNSNHWPFPSDLPVSSYDSLIDKSSAYNTHPLTLEVYNSLSDLWAEYKPQELKLITDSQLTKENVKELIKCVD